uniref:ATP-dependent DNA helicase n=1 Tax=Caenorhabditis tropicalis TaxID=1561998 RepID=A0A1I7SZD7_9PELO
MLLQTHPLYLLVHGSAGSGKSLLLKAIRNGVREHFKSDDSCIVTARTAVGAALLDAHTINSLFILWSLSSKEDFLKSVENRQMNHLEWMRDSKVILIDIINFVDAIIFATIDHRLREITGKSKPFGGLSVIVFGDFYQLPPVNGYWIFEGLPNELLDTFRMKCPGSPDNLWNLFKIVELDENRKNSQSPLEQFNVNGYNAFYYLKKNCRLCWDSDQTIEEIVDGYIWLCENYPGKTFAVVATTGDMVKDINDAIVERAPDYCEYPAEDSVNSDFPKHGLVADKDLMVSDGCPVILTCNIPEYSLKNGAQGVVVNFDDEEIFVDFSSVGVSLRREDFVDNKKRERWSQFPIRVAYAHTIERSQGMHFDGVVLVRNKSWKREERYTWMDEHKDGTGELYTALSRARDLKLCFVTPLRNPQFRVAPEATEEIERMRRDCPG